MAVTVADAASELADAAAAARGLADVMATMEVVSLTAALDAAAAEGRQVAWRLQSLRPIAAAAYNSGCGCLRRQKRRRREGAGDGPRPCILHHHDTSP